MSEWIEEEAKSDRLDLRNRRDELEAEIAELDRVREMKQEELHEIIQIGLNDWRKRIRANLPDNRPFRA